MAWMQSANDTGQDYYADTKPGLRRVKVIVPKPDLRQIRVSVKKSDSAVSKN